MSWEMGTQCSIGILSDTHDHVDNIKKALRIFSDRNVDLILHCGDFVSPFALAPFKDLFCPFAGIFGNNEGEKAGLTEMFSGHGVLQEPPLQYRFKEYLFFITHIPFDFTTLAQSGTYTAILYGHSHVPEVKKGKTLIINPGECCGWLAGKPTIGILILPQGEVEIIPVA